MAPREWLFAALLAVGALPNQESTASDEPTSVVRYFSLGGEVDRGDLNRVLRESSTVEAEYRLLYGPVTAPPRPKQAFVAVEAPASVSARDLSRLLKKSCDGVEELVWTRFDGGAATLPAILGQPGRDCIIGMASEMRWFHHDGDRKLFFHLPGKLDAEEIASRFHRLFEPFQAGEVGTQALEPVRIALTDPVDPARVERALKGIRKLSGVQRAVLESGELVVTVVLASQATSGPAEIAEESPDTLPTPCFDRQPVLALLEKEGVGHSRP